MAGPQFGLFGFAVLISAVQTQVAPFRPHVTQGKGELIPLAPSYTAASPNPGLGMKHVGQLGVRIAL